MSDSSRRFTSDEMKSVIDRYVAGESIDQLAAAFACSSKMIRNTLDRSGVKKRPQMRKRLFANEIEAEICRRYIAGESSDALAVAFSTNGRTILNIIGRGGVEKRPSASVSNPVVTDETKRAAVEMCVGGATYNETAAAAGISTETLRRAMREAEVSLPDRAKKQRTHTVNDAAFDVLTPESLYWMGFLFADGHVCDNEDGMPALAIGLSAVDRGHLEKLRTFLGSTHMICEREAKENAPAHEGGPKIKTGPTVYFSVRSRRICDALRKYGFTTKRLRAPAAELADSRDFWRGMVDGDGSVGVARQRGHVYPYITLAGQAVLLDVFQDFLRRRNLADLHHHQQDSIRQVATSGSTAKAIIRTLYENASIALDRKFERARQILA